MNKETTISLLNCRQSASRKIISYLRALLFILLLAPSSAFSSDVTLEMVTRDVPELDSDQSLPDMSAYSVAGIQQQIVLARTKPKAKITRPNLLGQVEVRWLYAGKNFWQFAQMQNSIPKSITIANGTADLEDLHTAFPRYVVKETDSIYLAKLPIVVSIGAGLIIDGKTLKLSQEKGVFISNGGTLYITHSSVLGWREKESSAATYQAAEAYRPFVTSWGGSELYIADSKLSNLGYAESKSFGVTLTSYKVETDDRLFQRKDFDFNKLASSWIVDSTFVDNYYGFYCDEANRVVLQNNRYKDNIVNGVAPQNVAERLIVANNQVMGTKEKHGIVISNKHSKSFVFNNASHENSRSGIALDNQSENNYLYNNMAYKNGGDGITVYESNSNVIAKNKVYGNDSHGIRVRNSERISLVDNYILSNNKYGVFFDTEPLAGSPSDNSSIDVANQNKSSGYVHGGVIANNHSGSVYSKSSEFISLFDLKLEGNGASALRLGFGGDIEEFHNQIVKAMLVEKQVVSLSKASVVRQGAQ